MSKNYSLSEIQNAIRKVNLLINSEKNFRKIANLITARAHFNTALNAARRRNNYKKKVIGSIRLRSVSVRR